MFFFFPFFSGMLSLKVSFLSYYRLSLCASTYVVRECSVSFPGLSFFDTPLFGSGIWGFFLLLPSEITVLDSRR